MGPLTKSLYVSGLRCTKLLWNGAHEKLPPPDEEALARFAEGNEVNIWARKRYPGGILVPPGHQEVVCTITQELLPQRKPLFEAGFTYDDLYARCDILLPEGDGWHLIEVKSSGELKDEHLEDITFQRYVVESAGLKIVKCSVMHLNKEYVRNGEVDVEALFVLEDMTRITYTTAVPEKAERFRILLAGEEPTLQIGTYCNKPYDCPLKDCCWSFLPEDSIMEVPRLSAKAFEAVWQGHLSMIDAEGHVKLNPKQQIVVQAHRTKRTYVDKDAIRKFIGGLVYPLCFFDFETVISAVPHWNRCKPHQQVPFQYSLHVMEQDGSIRHYEHLAEKVEDPRPGLFAALQEHLPASGSVIVYYASFERSRLKELAELCPEYADWVNSVLPRIVDLYDVFNNMWYYDPKQHGSCSIKKVLPALCGNGYGNLEIQHGGMAMREFARITYSECDPVDRERVRRALLTYCQQDTRSMIDLLNRLRCIE